MNLFWDKFTVRSLMRSIVCIILTYCVHKYKYFNETH